MNCSMPGLPVRHQLPGSTQTHVHRVSDAIQPSHPLSSPSPPALNLSQHQGLFQWVSSLHQVDKEFEFQLQYQSFQWAPRTELLQDGLVGSPCNPRDSQESSPTLQFKSINSSVLSFLYSPTLTSIHDYWKTQHSTVTMCESRGVQPLPKKKKKKTIGVKGSRINSPIPLSFYLLFFCWFLSLTDSKWKPKAKEAKVKPSIEVIFPGQGREW